MRRPTSHAVAESALQGMRQAQERRLAVKKSTSVGTRTSMQSNISQAEVIGIDLGDRTSHFVGLNGSGEVVAAGRVTTTAAGMAKEFGSVGPKVIAIETGTHSPWVS